MIIRRISCLASVLALLCSLGCGGGPAPRPARLDVLEHVYLRGPAADGQRIALTFDGIGACTPALLDALAGTAEAPRRVPATFFVDPSEWIALAEDDARKDALARLAKDGHAVALGPRTVPSAWRGAPTAMRQGLVAMADALAARARSVGLTPLRAWRPRESIDLNLLGRAADAERPVVLWSVHADLLPGEGEARIAALTPRLTADAIVALPGGGAQCPAVEALPPLLDALSARGLTPTTIDALLGARLARHTPPRLVRFRGPGLPPQCAVRGLTAEAGDPSVPAARWGLVLATEGADLRVLPLPGVDRSTADVLVDPTIRGAWADRAQWRSAPGCLRRVARGQLLSPVSATHAGRRIKWWHRTQAGLEPRDPRVVVPTGSPVLLPTRADLVRIEARQRLPWGLRGVVGDALDRLGLEAPLLLEAGAGTALVIGRPLAPTADDATIRAAIGGVVQIVEVTLGEYLFLAWRDPRALTALQTAARAADGFLRAGPWLILPTESVPDLRRIGPDGRAPLGDGIALIRAVLRAGASLKPGDVIAAGVPPVRGPPRTAAPPGIFSRRARLRHALARSILEGSNRPAYLRPGAVMTVEGDLLGRQTVRIAVPAGIAVPSRSIRPLVEQQPTEGR